MESCPLPRSIVELPRQANIRLQRWGLPAEFVKRASFSDFERAPVRLGSDGRPHPKGEYWAFSTDMFSMENFLACHEGRTEVSTYGDLNRCSANLTWLARHDRGRNPQHVDFAELFSPPRIAPVAQKLGLKIDPDNVFDLTAGWDVKKKQARQKFRKFQTKRRPKMLMCSPICKPFSAWRHINHPKMDPRKLRLDLEEGHLMWNFSLEAIDGQLQHEDYFGLEHPGLASSWSLPATQKLLKRADVALITFDMCHFGLTVNGLGDLSQKTTKIATNNPWLGFALSMAQCTKDHFHQQLVGGLASKAQEYPPALCKCIAESTEAAVLGFPVPCFLVDQKPSYFLNGFEEDEEEEPEEDSEVVCTKAQVTEAQKQLIHKVHINLGHPAKDRLLRAFRSAGALPQVLEYIRQEFTCDDCAMKQKPDVRRKAQLPRTYAFNKIVCVDVFYVKWRDQQVALLNMIDLGTSYQVVARAEAAEGTHGGTPTSAAMWHLFSTTWIRHYGAPTMLICDSGNEFKGAFERSLENAGVFQHVIHPESPWENGLAERHGGWVKNRIFREIDSGRGVVQNLQDLDELVAGLTATKNNYLNKGGYSPCQLVFGQSLWIPGELLTEDDLLARGTEDAFQDPLEIDEAAGEFRKRFNIRQRARQLAMEQDSRDALQGAQKAATHQGRVWVPGQWVYVYRRAKANQELHLRNRWVGPGVVVLANNQTIYVGMRSRLWRCTSEQLRPALPSEILGKDLASDPALASLLRKVISGSRTGAVDVTKEGPPPDSAHWEQVEQVQEGTRMSEDIPPDDAPQQAPVTPEPVPPGLVGPRRDPSLDNEAVETPMTSRRASTTEPASEPDINPGEIQLPSPMIPPPGLSPIAEEDQISSEGEAPQEPPSKMPRMNSPEVEGTHVGSGEPSSSSTTRAPGTPVRSLLDRIPRLTPAEELSHEGNRVARQVDEVNHLRSVYDHMQGEQSDDLFQQEGWSGTFFNYQRGTGEFALDEDGTWTFLAKRNDEISLKELNADELKRFGESDKLEWDAILKTKAVQVLTGKEAEQARRKHPDRIISSRMVRRKKPMPELHSWKAKSRWCLHGHCDPDTGTLTTYAPTPQSEGMMMFLQTGLNYSMKFAFSDVKNAFCQSKPLRRPRGPLYAEPCEGLHLPPGALIEILIPVYGLDDAPAAWRTTVAEFLVDLGFGRNIVEPCWYSKFKNGKLCAMVLVEVDDFIVAAVQDEYPALKKSMEAKFLFGKWQEDEAEYAGRHVKCTEDAIYVDQYKYIHEQIHPIPLAKGRRQEVREELSTDEFTALRSLIYKVNWVARESRPEATGIASILASKLKWARVGDILTLNKFVNFLRTTAERPLKLWKYNPESMVFIVCSDAGGINTKGLDLEDEEGLPTDATQGAWLVLAAERLPCGRQQIKASPIAWRSSKLKRKVFSTYGGETQAMLQGVNEVDWLQIMYRDSTAHDVQLANWRNSLSPHMLIMRGQCTALGKQQQCSVTDAKSLYDCLLREHPTGKQDRKSALELAIVLRDLQETQSMVRWIPHQKMIVDCLTKEDPLRANDALNQFVKTGILSLVDVEQELDARKNDPAFKKRSHAASRERLLKEYQQSYVQLTQTLVNYIWGDCFDSPVVHDSTLDQGLTSSDLRHSHGSRA